MEVFRDPKDPDDSDNFAFDWANRLTTGETISTCAASVTAGDVSVSGSVTISGSVTTVRLTGGTNGTTADVRLRMTTSAARQLDETMRIQVRTR
jgi:hypothetical protein